MTDKEQITIHGVDVSECEHITYKDSLNPMCGNTGICCYGRENCNFKQLVRKTQECEELEERLERTEEDLKYQCADCMNIKSDRYLKALEEIEEVCLEDTRTFADGTQVRYNSLDEILSIISKAKGE